MTLHALDHHPPRQGAAAAVADGVAKNQRRGGLADDGVVDLLAFGFQPLDHAAGAIDGRAFLVAGDQQRIEPG